MPYFKGSDGSLHFLDDMSFTHLLPNDCVEITDDEASILTHPHPKTLEEIIAEFSAKVQARLDTFARTRGYDGILSACTYATSMYQKFSTEGQYCVNSRDATWAKCHEVLNDVQSNQRSVPTWEELEAELPVLSWPT
jgi:hypothetical protein